MTYSFSEEAISHALDAAKATYEGSVLDAKNSDFKTHRGGCMLVSAECIKVTTQGHRVCINLPLGFGKHCFSLPVSIPSGSIGQACISICTTWGIPTGVKVSIVIGGVTVVSQSFGKC
ncbi:MAG: hypothetical protein ACPGTO_02175 [Polaribacter sp.]